jgi:hypothetical protein
LTLDGHPVQILGVNGIGYESGNDRVTENRDIPWLQDTEDVDAWSQWNVQYRDVYILDQAGQLRFIYNLTLHDLSNPDNLDHFTEAILGLIE